MVYRRFNKAIGKIGNRDVYWMSEVMTSEWVCRRCFVKQPEKSVAVEMWVKGNKRMVVSPEGNQIGKHEGEKLWVCLACAELLFDEVLSKIRIVRGLGKEAYRLMDEV